jgi:1-acyl-sn-glycerol-3-phosphate acyltransferase
MPIKFLPFDSTRRFAQGMLNALGKKWIVCNRLIGETIYGITFEHEGLDNPEIRLDRSYVIICNHQSFADIYFLQSVLNSKLPLLKFFIKSTLIYVPIMGWVWWGLDYPFVKRYSRAELIKHPELGGRDLQNVVDVCRRYRYLPTALLNFLEGHRRSPERMEADRDKNPYKHLLRPHAGGVSVALTAMRESLHGVLDVTVAYPGDKVSLKDILFGHVRRGRVVVEFIPIAEVPVEKDIGDARNSEAIKKWVNDRWAKKDKTMEQLLAGFDRG